jgi:predicted DNA binding CopG/RHH family protein
MEKNKKEIPEFSNEDEEREFWNSHDSVDYIDWDEVERTLFPKLKPSTETISLRLNKGLLETAKVQANKRDIPYQSYIKMLLAEALIKEASSGKEYSPNKKGQ